MDVSPNPFLLLLTYDPVPDRREAYFQYVLGEFVPTLERIGLSLQGTWHTAYGAYPLRLASFSAPDLTTLQGILSSETFQRLETRLQDYVVNYNRRVVPVRRGFQF
jgi:hypothetical protein